MTQPKLLLSFGKLHRVTAIQHMGSLHGTTAPLLIRADDGHLYVTKLTTNPLSRRILVNEYLAMRLARGLGLATPDAAIVRVPETLGITPGLHFGSRIQRGRGNVYIEEWLPAEAWSLVENPTDLVGAYVFDAWTANADCRQFVFVRRPGLASLRMLLIDNGHCFGAYSWRLPGIAAQCPVQLRFAYASVTGWQDFEPWLSVIEQLDSNQVGQAAEGVPEDWLPGAEMDAFRQLLAQLDTRRFETRALIADGIDRRTHPFPRWRYRSSLFIAPAGRAAGKTA